MKLPGIEYGRVQLPQGRSPQEAVARAHGTREIAGALFSGINAIHQVNEDYKVQQAGLRHQNDMALSEQTYGNRETFTAKEVEDFGLAEYVELEEDGRRRELIPAREVYPLLRNQQAEDSITAHASLIRNPQRRAAWVDEMHSRRVAQSVKDVDRAQKQALEWALKERQLDIAEAQVAGNFDGAANIINIAYAGDENARREMLQENAVMKERSRINQLGRDGGAEQLREEAAYMGTSEYLAGSPLDDQQRHDAIGYLERMAKVREAEAKAGIEEARSETQRQIFAEAHELGRNKQLSSEWLSDAISNPALTPAQINSLNALFDNYLESARESIYAKQSDPKVVSQLRRDMVDNDVSYAQAARSLESSRGMLTEAHWHELDRALIKKADPVQQGGQRSTENQVAGKLRSIGVIPSQTKNEAMMRVEEGFRSATNNAIAREAAAKNRELTDEEVTAVIDRTFITEKRELEVPFFNKKGDNVFDLIARTEKENFNAAMSWIESEMRKNGGYFTPAEYFGYYQDYRKFKKGSGQ